MSNDLLRAAQKTHFQVSGRKANFARGYKVPIAAITRRSESVKSFYPKK